MPTERHDDFKLPGGTATFGEVKAQYGEESATKAFDCMERIQAGEAGVGELLSLYHDWAVQESGASRIVLGDEVTVHHADPGKKDKLRVRPLARGGDG